MALTKCETKLVRCGGRIMKFPAATSNPNDITPNPNTNLDIDLDTFDTLLGECPTCGHQMIMGECTNPDCPSKQ